MILEWLYRRALVRQLLATPPDDAPNWTAPMDRATVDRLVARELAAVPASIVEHYRYQDREARILNDRLARRYDPGQAVNEAAQRAIQAKQASGERSPDNLTDKQKLALEVQKAHLQRVVRDS
jgi:hypothetical protein